MRRITLPALLLLGACAAHGPDPATAQGQCEEQAWHDPAVEKLVNNSGSTSQDIKLRALMDLPAARKRASTKCLQALGLAPPGGVEPVKPRWDR